MAAKGWSAKGLLQPLWQSYPGKRDALAAAVGTPGATLSAINTGKRNLGIGLAQRLADELGVTVYDLGAPTAQEAAAQATTLLERVEALEAELADARRELAALRRQRGDAA